MRLCNGCKYVRSLASLPNPTTVNRAYEIQTGNQTVGRHVFTLRGSDVSEESWLLSEVWFMGDTYSGSVSWAAPSILALFCFTLAGPLAVSLLHIPLQGYLLIWANLTHRIQDSLSLSVSLLCREPPSASSCHGYPEPCPLLLQSRKLGFSVGILDTAMACPQTKQNCKPSIPVPSNFDHLPGSPCFSLLSKDFK